MPNLPTITLSQAHYDRVVAAFPGATAADKTAAYRAWTTNRLIERVQAVEMRKVQEQHNAAARTAEAAVIASLPDRVEEPE